MLIAIVVVAVLVNSAECIFNKVKPGVCFLEMDAGSGLGKFRRYYYDSGTAECKPFYFGGGDGNENNFERLADCQRMCRNVCILPKKQGPCKARQPAYYFNTTLGKCVRFTFGGCEPNANNFPTLNDCKRVCPDVNPICMEESFIGNAVDPNYTVKYAFNTFEWKCKPFVYSGKGGNNNNFDSNAECESNCPLRDLCRFPPVHGPCTRSQNRWHYDILSRQCLMFVYGGCLGNDNNFATKEACEKRCPERDEKPGVDRGGDDLSICQLPKKAGEVGPSQKNKVEAQDRFYYDAQSQSCKYFQYAGFGGNANNFPSVEICNLHCPIRSPCVDPLDVGSGALRLIRWYYNLATGFCEPFDYRGQGGNRNRFGSKRICQETCVGCADEQDRGPCLGFQLRYSYNSTTGTCNEFVFGGCRGNRNNFRSVDQCYKRCQ